MSLFFGKDDSMKAVRAFYSLLEMWTGSPIDFKKMVRCSDKFVVSGINSNGDAVSDTLEGLVVTKLDEFRAFVNGYVVYTDTTSGEDIDLFFQYYDKKLIPYPAPHNVRGLQINFKIKDK